MLSIKARFRASQLITNLAENMLFSLSMFKAPFGLTAGLPTDISSSE